jgi:hypothetical protein
MPTEKPIESTLADELADELTRSLRLGVEDDVTIPFDLCGRIHAFLKPPGITPPQSGEVSRQNQGVSATPTGLSPTVEPASRLDGSTTSIPSARGR